MEPTEVWRAIDVQRDELADLLEALSPDEWEHPSLCPGWRVRDVAAHLTMAANASGAEVLWEIVRARGDFNRMIQDSAVRRARRPTAEIVATVRATVGSRRLAPRTTVYEPLLDLLVHQQDIVRPLGRRRDMPLAEAQAAATRVWEMGFPFGARHRLAGTRLIATDVDWTVGEGAEVCGPIAALLLTLSGRTVALSELTGPGLDRLRATSGTPRPAP
ncbi:maleylpyruvate isomerase family mycothiol-dependent enzyme [Cryptosporangium minutisporangium]|uniref:Maleylpyruvate isomerase family mycothiol-dependent enzyme n=1 Tax=Cryptosporangium minutisporangium TaxID=113569 RepID=A0ABP6T1Z7_9ACTN